jgi:hypothetical protein
MSREGEGGLPLLRKSGKLDSSRLFGEKFSK